MGVRSPGTFKVCRAIGTVVAVVVAVGAVVAVGVVVAVVVVVVVAVGAGVAVVVEVGAMLKISTVDGARGGSFGAPMAQHTFPDWASLARWLEQHAQRAPLAGAKRDLPAWIPCDFTAPERVDAAVGHVWLLVLDLDRAEPERLRDLLAGLDAQGVAYAWHGSPSWPCASGYLPVRVILPLARPVPAASWRATRSAAIRALGLTEGKANASHVVDASTSNPSRLYFLPGAWWPDPETCAKHGRLEPVADPRQPWAWRDGVALDPAGLVVEQVAAPALPSREVIEGERHDRIFRAACSARARGHDVNAAVRAINARCKPPLDETEISALISDVIARYPAGHGLTDLGNAELLAERHGSVLRHVHGIGWLTWAGSSWAEDTTERATACAAETVRSLYAEAAASTDDEAAKRITAHARACEAAGRIAAMLSLARAPLACAPEVLDRDPYALGTANATLDLRTGQARPHDARDMITRASPVIWDPQARAPIFAGFLERVMPRAEVRAFLARWFGYCLTGDTREQRFLFAVGDGANGKSVLMSILSHVFGAYAVQAPPKFLVERRFEPHPTEILRTRGARLLVASELSEGERWAEERIKAMTGGERLAGRSMGKDFVEFATTAKIVVSANHRPRVTGTDHAIWRRMLVVPFDVTIPEAQRDASLAARIIAQESAGVLRWLVEGCLAWQREGLGVPRSIVDAVAEYRDDEDTLGAWIRDETIAGESTLSELFASWCRWSARRGEEHGTENAFARQLNRRGITGTRNAAGARVRALAVKGWSP